MLERDGDLHGRHGMDFVVQLLRPSESPRQWAARIEYVGAAVLRCMAAAAPSAILRSEDDVDSSVCLGHIEAVLRLEAARAKITYEGLCWEEEENMIPDDEQ